jgi:superfamily II DNA or RNA helicase
VFDGVEFRYPFRKYQRLILAHLEGRPRRAGDDRLHIVAPPGSGKTIVGLELIRRGGTPAVVFAPTSTIQQQWCAEVTEKFLPEGYAGAPVTSMDPLRLAPISVFTYQLLSVQAESDDLVKDLARREWIEEIVTAGQVDSEPAAERRLATMSERNPRAYSKELRSRAVRVKHAFLRGEDPDVARFLHENARRLIDDLVGYGVRTVVLDECHHLLDYWAVVIGELIRLIPEPTVVGLTATLPSPEDGFEYENYTGLLGDVDYEVPTPAVVKEGDLAPYRDLVGFVEPTEEERKYLADVQGAFSDIVSSVSGDERFRTWVASAGFQPVAEAAGGWEVALRENVPLAVAALRFLRSAGIPGPQDVPVPVEVEEDPTLDDWLMLLERYGLDALKASADREDHRRLTELRRALKSFGFTLTERGLRHARSPGDLVLAYSESKVAGGAEILRREGESLGERLRAIVITDFERTGASRRLEDLETEAGSARHVFLSLVAHPAAGKLDPILVTGRTLWIDADHGGALLARFNEHLARTGARATCRLEPGDAPGVLEVRGEGPDWSTRTYVAMVTEAFEAGSVRCLVGTRGLFAEGWDALTLNTLVDLTSATTSSSVQQLRGRSIRKDPGWPRKVAHNWDVVCVSKRFDRGDSDLRRLIARHASVWGVIPPSKAVGREQHGRVVKGLLHVDPQLVDDLTFEGFKKVDYGASTRRMLAQIPKRDESYDLWGVGDEYSNFSYAATRVDARDLKIRTVFTVEETLKRMFAAFRLSLIASLALGGWLGARAVLEGGAGLGSWFGAIGVVLGIVAATVLVLNARTAWRLGRKILRDQPADAILLDVGRALFLALQDAGLLSRNLQVEFVRVVEQPDLSYDVLLDYASPEDAAVFVEAYREVFEPVRDQRYLIRRSDRRLPKLWLAPLWAILRVAFRPRGGYPPAYHPVPKVLAAKKERAEAFAQHWRRFVGVGDLVYTRRPEGWRVLSRARAERRPKVKSLAFELWR